MSGRTRLPVAMCGVWTLVAAATACAARPASPITPADRAAIAANDSAYVSAWLRDDTTGVLAAFEAEPVLVPGGLRPVVGRDATRRFWWPTDGSHTKVTYFVRSIDEIDGAGDVGFIRGSDSLRFTATDTNGHSSDAALRSITLAVVRRQPDGRWRIARMAWSTVTH